MHVGKWPVTMRSIKRLAGVEVDLGECTLYSPTHSGFGSRGNVIISPKQEYQWPQVRIHVCVRQKHFKKKQKHKKETEAYVLHGDARWHTGKYIQRVHLVVCLSNQVRRIDKDVEKTSNQWVLCFKRSLRSYNAVDFVAINAMQLNTTKSNY